MSSDLYDRLKRINTHSSAPAFVNAYSIGNGVYPVDASGGVYVFSGTSSNFTAWTAIKTDISANVTRVVGNDSVIACLRNDNKLIVFRSGSNYKSYGGDFNSSDTNVTNNAHLPPSNYIVNNNTLQNIKDVFPSRTGFAAIDTSDNVICWGWKNANYVNNIDHTKVYGGDFISFQMYWKMDMRQLTMHAIGLTIITMEFLQSVSRLGLFKEGHMTKSSTVTSNYVGWKWIRLPYHSTTLGMKKYFHTLID